MSFSMAIEKVDLTQEYCTKHLHTGIAWMEEDEDTEARKQGSVNMKTSTLAQGK